MNILFAIQGTGNGHISRAREIVPLLQQYGDVDLLISGTQADVQLEQPVNYRFHGFSFIFGKKGGVDHWQTYKTMRLSRLLRDVRSLPLKKYQLIINDYEPVTAWACRLQGRHSVALSHQSSFLSSKTPRPQKSSPVTELLFKYYAPTTQRIGFHFERYDDFIHTPVIRGEIRNTEPEDKGHITVYLPAFDDKLLVKYFRQIPDVQWHVFSKHAHTAYTDANVRVRPVNNMEFNVSLAGCYGLFTGGGFEGPAEALYLKKKVLVFPMRFQYEQLCNAEAISQLGVPVIYQIDDEFVPKLRQWIDSPQRITVDFPDETAQIIRNLVKDNT